MVDFPAVVDGNRRIDPCYQLDDYLAKFRYLHTVSKYMEFDGILYFRKTHYTDSCRIVYEKDVLEKYLSWLDEPVECEKDSAYINRFSLISTHNCCIWIEPVETIVSKVYAPEDYYVPMYIELILFPDPYPCISNPRLYFSP